MSERQERILNYFATLTDLCGEDSPLMLAAARPDADTVWLSDGKLMVRADIVEPWPNILLPVAGQTVYEGGGDVRSLPYDESKPAAYVRTARSPQKPLTYLILTGVRAEGLSFVPNLGLSTRMFWHPEGRFVFVQRRFLELLGDDLDSFHFEQATAVDPVLVFEERELVALLMPMEVNLSEDTAVRLGEAMAHATSTVLYVPWVPQDMVVARTV